MRTSSDCTSDESAGRARCVPEREAQAFPLVRTRQHALEQYLDREVERRARPALARARGAAPGALVRVQDAPDWLMWRGVPVSPEFQRYAVAVARGEPCPPFRGRVLSQASGVAFRWDLQNASPARVAQPPGRWSRAWQAEAARRAELERRGGAPREPERWSIAQCVVVILLLSAVVLGGALTLVDPPRVAPSPLGETPVSETSAGETPAAGLSPRP